MKYLRTFATKSEYKTEKKNHSLVIPNVSYIKNDGSVYMTPAFATKFNAETGDIVVYSKESYDAWVATTDEDSKSSAFQRILESVRFVKPEFYTKELAEIYIPDSIVVVPYSHSVDNKVHVMSLKYMDPSAPTTGSTSPIGIVWGANVDISGITNYTGVVKLNAPSLGSASGLSSTNNSNLPSDVFTALEVPNSDTDYYWSNATASNAPCPYNSDGSVNQQFLGYDSTTGTSLTNNVFLDRDGLANTKAILNTLATAYLDKTLMGDTISNSQTYTYSSTKVTTYSYDSTTVMTATDVDGTVTYVDSSNNELTATANDNVTTYADSEGKTVVTATTTDGTTTYVDSNSNVLTAATTTTDSKTNIFPAAMCCQRYSSVLFPNTVSVVDGKIGSWGDWFLPTANEDAYYCVGRGQITYALSQINAVSDITGVTAAPYNTDWLCSSSEYGGNYAWGLGPSSGCVGDYGKGNSCRVRAFAAF